MIKCKNIESIKLSKKINDKLKIIEAKEIIKTFVHLNKIRVKKVSRYLREYSMINDVHEMETTKEKIQRSNCC